MPTPDPEADVASLVATATGRTLGASLFRGKILAVGEGAPADCIFIRAHRGERNQPFVGSSQTLWGADVEVTVRGPAGDRESARATATTVLHALQKATSGGGFSGYTLALVVDGVPEDLEQDTNQCHLFAVAVTVQWMA